MFDFLKANWQFFLWFFIIAVGIIIILKIVKSYTLKYDNVIEFVGGEGSGKTLSGVQLALFLWRRNVKRWKRKKRWVFLKFWKTKEQKEEEIGLRPKLYTNIPVFISKKFGVTTFSNIASPDILTLVQGMEPCSVLFIDELGQMIDQYVNYRNDLIRYDVREFFRLFRQYTKGGYLVATDQVSDDGAKPIRDRINVFYYCFDFKALFKLGHRLFYRYRIRSFLKIEGNIAVGSSGSFVEDGTKWKYGYIKKKLYDTYCYSGRYEKLQNNLKNERWSSFKTNKILQVIPHISPLDDKDDALEKKIRLKGLAKKYGKDVGKQSDDDVKKKGGDA
jgi:hypothetical protein